MELGTARARPGAISRGHLEATELPTGGTERLPVIIAAGETDGPTLWITASLHGDEVTPLAVAQDLVRPALPDRLQGTVVCLPVCNPAGLRRTERRSYYHDDDPNRYFPAFDREGKPERDERRQPPRTQERIDRRVYEAFAGTADALLDLHTAQIDSLPHSIRDQVLYGERREREAARKLNDRFDRLLEAVGLPVVNEFPVPEYFERNFHRTLSGSALNAASVPAATIELGGHTAVDEKVRETALSGIYRTMVELGMIPAVPEDRRAQPIASPVDCPVKRHDGPRIETTGIVRHRVSAGDVLEAGDPVADVVTPHGDVIETVESEHEGYVLARKPGVAFYENDAVCSLAVHDDSKRVERRTE